VVDQQVANFEFASGVTGIGSFLSSGLLTQSASLSVIAFTEEVCVRKTRIFGTLGQIEGDGASVTWSICCSADTAAGQSLLLPDWQDGDLPSRPGRSAKHSNDRSASTVDILLFLNGWMQDMDAATIGS
jgi:hypothetical protein